MDLKTLKVLAFRVLDDLRDRGYFQKTFGYSCVDAGDVPGTLGEDVEGWFLLTLHRKNIDPFGGWRVYWDQDTFFDVLEVMHDLCSKGVDGYHHTYGECGMHYETFDDQAGTMEYREAMNQVLARFERPLEMNQGGEVLEAAPEAFRPLLKASMPRGTDPELVTRRVDAAVSLFRGRSATAADRRRAVRDLADALEPLRATIKEEALPKDERELFRLANGFSIRHNNREQLSQYDDEIWLRWAFYVYLATIHAAVRLGKRQQEAGSPS